MRLSLQGLSKRYERDTYAVRELSLAVPEGTIAALLGHNGAGKSTTLRMAAGVLAPTAGTVLLDGVAVTETADGVDPARRRRIGYLPESTQLLEYLTAEELLWFVGELSGVANGQRLAEQVAAMSAAFGLDRTPGKLIRELSAGLKRRVAIASVMLGDPDLLLLDEPTSHLDPIGVKLLKEHLLRRRSEGAAMLLATHRLEIAEQLCDDVIVLESGTVAFQGSLAELRARFAGRGHADSLEYLYAALLGN